MRRIPSAVVTSTESSEPVFRIRVRLGLDAFVSAGSKPTKVIRRMASVAASMVNRPWLSEMVDCLVFLTLIVAPAIGSPLSVGHATGDGVGLGCRQQCSQEEGEGQPCNFSHKSMFLQHEVSVAY